MSRSQIWTASVLTALGLMAAGAQDAHAALICGDYNQDESITAPDALGALQAAVKIVQCQRAVCDYSGDNSITTRDALSILKTAVGTGPEPRCPEAGCNGPECKPTCPSEALDCCDAMTCSGHGACAVDDDVAVCDCEEGWVGATCNAPATLYPFATKPTRQPPVWTTFGDVLVRPPSYEEQMRLSLRPGTYFIANDLLRAHVEGGKPATTVPFVFPDGGFDRYDLEVKDSYTSDVRLIETRAVEGKAETINRFPEITVYRSLYETDGSVRSVLQLTAVDQDGGFVVRGVARHSSNFPHHEGPFEVFVKPLGSTIELDDIVPVNGTIDESTLLMTEAFFTDSHQAELFEDCDGLSICSDLCADMGVDIGDPGPACPPPPDECEHVSPCGDGHGVGEPFFIHQCNDDIDNDGDELLDGDDPNCQHKPTCEPGGDIPDHQHQYEAGMDFGLFGDVIWCTEHKDDWPALMLERGYYMETPFHKNTGDAEYDTLYKWGEDFYNRNEKLARLKVVGCWVLDTTTEAEACADDVDECGPFASGPHKYPYRFGRDAAGFWQGVKVDTWHARGLGMNEPLTAAQTYTSDLYGNSEAQFIPGFASVVGSNVTGDPDSNPHELGHCANLTHCDTREVNGQWTLEGNATQTNTCGPGEFGSHEQSRWSSVGGGKLFDCFTTGCALPRFGDPNPAE